MGMRLTKLASLPSALAWAFAGLAFAPLVSPASAEPQSHPAARSTGSIQISVSVAPRVRLQQFQQGSALPGGKGEPSTCILANNSRHTVRIIVQSLQSDTPAKVKSASPSGVNPCDDVESLSVTTQHASPPGSVTIIAAE